MAIQVWDKDGNVKHVEVDDFEAAFAAGLYFVTDPKEVKEEPVKRTRKSKAVADENQD